MLNTFLNDKDVIFAINLVPKNLKLAQVGNVKIGIHQTKSDDYFIF